MAPAASLSISGATLTAGGITLSASSSVSDTVGNEVPDIDWDVTSTATVTISDSTIAAGGAVSISANSGVMLSAAPDADLFDLDFSAVSSSTDITINNTTTVGISGDSVIQDSATSVSIAATDSSEVTVTPENADRYLGGYDLFGAIPGFIDVSSTVELNRTTSVSVTGSNIGADTAGDAGGALTISASNSGGIDSSIVSDSVGTVSHSAEDVVSVVIQSSDLEGTAVSITADNTAQYIAQGKYLTNDIGGGVTIDVDASIITSTAGAITIAATDDVRITANTTVTGIDLSAVEEAATLSLDLEVATAFNHVDRGVRAAVFGGSTVDSTGGDIGVSATRSAEITAETEATTLIQGTLTGKSTNIAGGGTFSQNTIPGQRHRPYQGQRGRHPRQRRRQCNGDRRLRDRRQGLRQRRRDARRAGYPVLLGTTAASVGVSVALNTIGWDVGNPALAALESLLGDAALLSNESPTEVSAYIEDSSVVAAGVVGVAAVSMSQVNSTVSNAVTSTSSTLYKGRGGGVSGLFSGNKVNAEVKAWIDEDAPYLHESGAATVDLATGDRVLHDGIVYEYLGDGEIGASLDDVDQDYATNDSDWRALAISAVGGVSVSASDASLIDANSKVSSTSVTTNDGGADFADDLTGFLYEVEFVTDGDAVTTDPFSLDPGTSGDAVGDPTMVAVAFGDRVRLTDDFPGGGAGTGTGGSVYEYLGVDATLDRQPGLHQPGHLEGNPGDPARSHRQQPERVELHRHRRHGGAERRARRRRGLGEQRGDFGGRRRHRRYCDRRRATEGDCGQYGDLFGRERLRYRYLARRQRHDRDQRSAGLGNGVGGRQLACHRRQRQYPDHGRQQCRPRRGHQGVLRRRATPQCRFCSPSTRSAGSPRTSSTTRSTR
ncbi:MAG: hypothetical protein M5U09_14645 [Gammaproteobacteria bacterium]|nr:hypothetical protein [Gammaproteobacteria bacterium]